MGRPSIDDEKELLLRFLIKKFYLLNKDMKKCLRNTNVKNRYGELYKIGVDIEKVYLHLKEVAPGYVSKGLSRTSKLKIKKESDEEFVKAQSELMSMFD